MLKFLTRSKPTQQDLNKLRNELHLALSVFDDQFELWQTAIEKIREFFDAEVATIYVVDETNPVELVSKAQSPLLQSEQFVIRHQIESKPRGGITSHAATLRKAVAFNERELKESKFVSSHGNSFLPSRECYSVLFSPIFDRRHRLTGLIRVNNKSASRLKIRDAFTHEDIKLIASLSLDLGTILESSRVYRILQRPFDRIARTPLKENAIDAILRDTKQLLNAGYVKLALWDRIDRCLKVAGRINRFCEIERDVEAKLGTDRLFSEIWDSNALDEMERPIWTRSSEGRNASQIFCDPASLYSLSVKLMVDGQAVGLLHCESSEHPFDRYDRNLIHEYSTNITTAVQSRSASSNFAFPTSNGFSVSENTSFSHSVLSHIPYVMWRKDLDGRLVWVNELFAKTVNLPIAEIIGKTDYDLFSSELATRFAEGDRIALENGFFQDFAEPFDSPELSAKTVHVMKLPCTNLLGDVVGTQGMLSWDANLYHSLFNDAPIAFLDLSHNGSILHANQTAVDLLKYGENELRGKRFWDLAGADREVVKRIIGALLSDDAQEHNFKQIILRDKNGQQIRARMWSRQVGEMDSGVTALLATKDRGSHTKEMPAQTVRLVCALREVRAGEEMEDLLRNPSPGYLARIQNIDLPVFCLDANLKVTFANESYLLRDNLDLSNVQGKSGIEIYDERGQDYHTDSQTVLTTGEVIDKDEIHLDRDGTESVVHVLKFPIRDPYAKPVGVQCIFWDSHQDEEAIAKLRNAFTLAQQDHAEEIDGMLTMLAHQLRSPVWQAYSKVDRLIRALDPHDQLSRGQASSAVRQLAPLRGLIRKTRSVAWNIDMLARLSRGESLELHTNQLISIPRAVFERMALEYGRDLQQMFQDRDSLDRYSQRIGGEPEPTIPELEIKLGGVGSSWGILGDREWIEQAIECVVQNAFKYSRQSSMIKISVTYGNYSTALAGKCASISVRNMPLNGLEFDEAACINCRRKNWRSTMAEAVDADGTGLGLYLVDQILRAHNGKLHVFETDDYGWNEIKLEFPLAPRKHRR